MEYEHIEDDYDCFCVGDAVREYREHIGYPVADKPQRLPKDRVEICFKTIEEELEEFRDTLSRRNTTTAIVWGAYTLSNLVSAIVGVAVEMGIPFDEVFEEVHRSNMTTPIDDEYGTVDENGKVRLPPVGLPPDILSIIRKAQQ